MFFLKNKVVYLIYIFLTFSFLIILHCLVRFSENCFISEAILFVL